MKVYILMPNDFSPELVLSGDEDLYQVDTLELAKAAQEEEPSLDIFEVIVKKL